MSSAGKITIWNQALGYLGTRRVAAESENCEEARQCALYWDTARRSCLRDFPFAWAQERAVLAQRALPEVWAADWRFAYALPENCLKLHRIGSLGRPLLTRGHAPYRLMPITGTTCILTDVAEAFAEFTRDVETPAFWDAAFTHLLARKLAALIIVPLLKNNGSKVQELEQLYRAAIPQAYEAAASEQRSKTPEDSWLSVR